MTKKKEDARHGMFVPRHYTEEGDAILREGFPNGVPDDELIAKMNALKDENERPWDRRALVYRVRKLHLYRPLWYRRQVAATSRKADPNRAVIVSPRRTLDDHRQKPLPIELTICPSRDGGISLAMLAALDEVATFGVAYCDRATASTWGKAWAGTDSDLSAINAKRREFALPEFKVLQK